MRQEEWNDLLSRPFASYLYELPPENAEYHVCVLVLGAVSAVQSDRSAWRKVERLLCDESFMTFCRRILRNSELEVLLDSLAEAQDLLKLLGPGEDYEKALSDVSERASALMRRKPRHDTGKPQ